MVVFIYACFQDREMRESGLLGHSAETAAEARAHSTATAERHYAAHGQQERVVSYVADFRHTLEVSS